MSSIIDSYVRFYAASGVETSTSEQCGEKLNLIFRHLSEKFGVQITDREIVGLDSVVLMNYYGWLAEERKMSTLNNYVSLLNPFLKCAYKSKWISEDLSTILTTHKLPSINKIPESERVDKYLTKEQIATLLDQTPGRNRIRDRAIIALFLGSGLRVTEMCSLTIKTVMDVPHGDIYVKRKGGEWVHMEISDYVYAYIEKYLETRTDTEDRDRPLFLTTHGNPCNRNQIYKAIAYKQKQVGAATGPHALRHTFISEAEKIGGVGVARDLANHKSITITNRYDHTTHEQRQAAVNALPWASAR